MHPHPQWTNLLSERFGFDSFRPWQQEAIAAVVDPPHRALVIAPTGGGKSLCYQFPAVLLPGTTVVISPLIALMEDQVRSLSERNIAATWLASTVDPQERADRCNRLERGDYDLVYIAPERLRGGRVLECLRRMALPLLAIDEAHCISQWGHDFRPDYRRLGQIIGELKPERVLACTATATPRVREDILHALGFNNSNTPVILRGFARPNLHLAATEISSLKVRRQAMLNALRDSLGEARQRKGACVVYAMTRKKTEQLVEPISRLGYRTAAYHAGLEAETRASVNRGFAARELDVVVATNAFGMGIDRPDIRAVVHFQPPSSIEGYYQEVGRAGRDGQPAYGLLMAGASDFRTRRILIEGLPDQPARIPERVEHDWQLFLDLMRYTEAGSCRHDFILRYFGDESETLGGCGNCDVCERLAKQESFDQSERDMVVRKALSAVARARGRAGIGAIADMLRGAQTKRQKQLGFVALSTHGLLKDRPAEFIVATLRRLVTADLVALTPGKYPVPVLTANGVDVMKGLRTSEMLLPVTTALDLTASPATAGKSSKHHGLFEALREARAKAASARGIPAFTVAHNRTLQEIAEQQPTTLSDLSTINGIGPAKLKRYGDLLIGVVKNHLQSAN